MSDLQRPNTKLFLNVYISVSMLFSKIRIGGTSRYMKPMPVICILVQLMTHCPICGILFGIFVL